MKQLHFDLRRLLEDDRQDSGSTHGARNRDMARDWRDLRNRYKSKGTEAGTGRSQPSQTAALRSCGFPCDLRDARVRRYSSRALAARKSNLRVS